MPDQCLSGSEHVMEPVGDRSLSCHGQDCWGHYALSAAQPGSLIDWGRDKDK